MMKVGILGGGQLGRMLLQAAANYPVEVQVMEKDPDCPAAHLCHRFVQGDIRAAEEVYRFGRGLNALTIEIESVNEEALERLENEGVKIYPRPSALRIIKNKIKQKQFYKEHEIPSAAFLVTENLADLRTKGDFVPAVHKIAAGGYDGRGVRVIQNPGELNTGFDAPAILEKIIPIQKEISLIIAINETGETALYPAVDMIFDPYLHVLDYQLSPADLPKEMLWRIEAIAMKAAKAFKSPGIFAVELFIDSKNEVYINETAPRVHNSGHHTIEGNFCSQFDMLWRVILGYPLGNTKAIHPSAMVNLLGGAGFQGDAIYEGLDEVLKMDNAFVHLYGKKQTREGRKMGHVTLLSKERSDLPHSAHKIKQILKVNSKIQ
jgi:5-(carboxyamino)imidazole ribonucleotide synthase